MGDVERDVCTATATVVRGGNRLLRVVAHVVCCDDNGQVRWADDAVALIPIPAGTEVPVFRCEAIRSEVRCREEAREPSWGSPIKA